MLHAKEYSPDGVVRGLDAEEMRGLFGIKAPLVSVKAGLAYLRERGWLVELPDGALLIRDFAQRQGADTPTQRTQRYRAGVKLRRLGSASPVADILGKAAARAAQKRDSGPPNEFNSEHAWLEARYRERHKLPPPAPLPSEWESEIRKELAG